ncbi:MAG: hypothetical protein ACOC80_15960 [Petrotogales bacterium]
MTYITDVIEIPVQVIEKNGTPTIALRKTTSEPEMMKLLISCAFHGKQIIVKPIFPKKIFSINALLEKGLIYQDKDTLEYKFTF